MPASRVALRDILTTLKSTAARSNGRNVRLSTSATSRSAGVLLARQPLERIARAMVAELVRVTPAGALVDVSARQARRSPEGSWIELCFRAKRARIGDRTLHRVLRAAGPVRLADVISDFHRGELRVTLVCRVTHLRDGWLIVRRGSAEKPSFALVLRV